MTATTTSPLRRWIGPGAWWVGLALLPLTVAVIVRTVDVDAIRTVTAAVLAAPAALAAALAIYAAAFVLRSIAWTRTLPALPLRHALAALHVSLGANHVLPLRLGEVLRVTSVVRRTAVPLAAAIASTVTMRAADILAVGVLAGVLGPGVALDVVGPWGAVLLVAAAVSVLAGGRWSARLRRVGHHDVRVPGPAALVLVLASWMLEGVVIHQAANWAGVTISPAEAVFVTAATIAAQVVAIAPGGLGTYEAAATAALAALGVAPGTALAIAVTAHAVKTGYALATGAAATMWPQPSLLGRLRLAGAATPLLAGDQPAADGVTDPDAPVVLFMPAHNEEATVGAVVRRVPAQVCGHPVHCVVIDDGSSDRTAARARAAGAQVMSSDRNRGLGAAVRRGLAEGVTRGAVAVAFCDADGEYAPEELETLVAPIVAGRADYVVGSRFAGTIRQMLPHRRFGNHVLTFALRFVTRAAISDGQSGYRALSGRAAAQAQVIHDFNYAQVLTIDLLARGARYDEVPISYGYRESGTSFVRLWRYLTAVIPAVHRQLNTEVTPLGRHATAPAERP
jgi:uncharacterized membrane protein YbhN (UPF0104 family)